MTPTEAWAVVRPDGVVTGIYLTDARADYERRREDRFERAHHPHRAVRVRIEEIKE